MVENSIKILVGNDIPEDFNIFYIIFPVLGYIEKKLHRVILPVLCPDNYAEPRDQLMAQMTLTYKPAIFRKKLTRRFILEYINKYYSNIEDVEDSWYFDITEESGYQYKKLKEDLVVLNEFEVTSEELRFLKSHVDCSYESFGTQGLIINLIWKYHGRE